MVVHRSAGKCAALPRQLVPPPRPTPSRPNPQFAESYDKALNSYMGFSDAGMKMDLTTVRR
jgi:hypothetical protein